jgi:excisionase family DNA binding protein
MGELLDVAGAARILGLSTATVYSLVERRRIPFVRMPAGQGEARTVRFDPSALEAWIFQHTVKPQNGAKVPV